MGVQSRASLLHGSTGTEGGAGGGVSGETARKRSEKSTHLVLQAELDTVSDYQGHRTLPVARVM